MARSLECPRCHLQVEKRAAPGSEPRCPACRTPLVPTSSPREADVRRYLYGRRLVKLRPPVGGNRMRTP